MPGHARPHINHGSSQTRGANGKEGKQRFTPPILAGVSKGAIEPGRHCWLLSAAKGKSGFCIIFPFWGAVFDIWNLVDKGLEILLNLTSSRNSCQHFLLKLYPRPKQWSKATLSGTRTKPIGLLKILVHFTVRPAYKVRSYVPKKRVANLKSVL